MGFFHNTYALLKNYLSERKQITVINIIVSTTLEITHDVLQGSTLGSLLFIPYINDNIIVSHLQGIHVSLYADDSI